MIDKDPRYSLVQIETRKGTFVKKTLLLSDFQKGKTYWAVNQGIKAIVDDPNMIPIFISASTHSTKISLDKHITREISASPIPYKCWKRWDNLHDLRQFARKQDCNRLKVDRDNRHVLTSLGHIDSLREIHSIVNNKDWDNKYFFNVFIDESDVYALDHEHTPTEIQRNNKLQAISESKHVKYVYHITATPTSHLVSDTDYNYIIEPDPWSEKYIGLKDVAANIVSMPKYSIDSLRSSYPDYKILDWLRAEERLGGISVITTISTMAGQRQQALHITKTCPRSLVVLFNSDKGVKAYLNGESIGLEQNDPAAATTFARTAGITKVFFIGYLSLNRSITLRDSFGPFNIITGMLFHSYKLTNTPALLQRLARVCGYSTYTPIIYTDMETLIMGHVDEHDRVLKGLLKNPELRKAEEREKFLVTFDFIMENPAPHMNGWGFVKQGIAYELGTDDLELPQASTKIVIPFKGIREQIAAAQPAGEYWHPYLPKDFFKRILDLNDTNIGRKKYFRDFVHGELHFMGMSGDPRILDVTRLSSKKAINFQKINKIDWEENFRDITFVIDKEKEELRFSFQPVCHSRGLKDYSLYSPLSNTWWGIPTSSGTRRGPKK